MRRSKRDLEIFSLSFLDIISCGFGAVVILILVSSNSKLPMPNTVEEASALLKEVINRKKIVEDLQYQLANEINDVAYKILSKIFDSYENVSSTFIFMKFSLLVPKLPKTSRK